MLSETDSRVPHTKAEWLAFESYVTRYTAEDGQERAVLLFADYLLLLALAKSASLNEPHG